MRKRYPPARSKGHARIITFAGLKPNKPLSPSSPKKIGPSTPLALSECIRDRFGYTAEQAAEVRSILDLAASGHVVRISDRLIARPAGDGAVTLELLTVRTLAGR